MKGLVIAIAVTAVAFAILVNVLPDTWIEYTGEPLQLALLSIGVGVVNAVIKPVIKLLSFPINMMTLGLFSLVINAALVLLVAWAADLLFDAGLVIGGFPPDLSLDAIVAAFIVGIVLTVVQTVAGLVARD